MIARLFIYFVLFLLLTGCKTELYGGLSEKEGNHMFAILYKAGISVDKKTDKDRFVTLLVEKEQSASAIDTLNNHGYPKDHFTNLGDVFSKEGLISSPTEEKARLIYALSQEISSTLSQIDGVLTARVHVVMPDKSEYGKKPEPTSASVFIKHTSDTNLDALTGKIRLLVANSIIGLTEKQVSVALFPSSANKTNIVHGGSISVITIIISTIFVLLLLALAGWYAYRQYLAKQVNDSGQTV
ncbi:MAG: type III secretion protein J [Psychrobacter glaciei]|jgi:type III secretion protein J